ncbi:MAG: hypothetical protein LBQ71_14820 [Hungatella sp.]|jgi:hypothetical protein|nr:hypothetical protein [Hungatella sp.]
MKRKLGLMIATAIFTLTVALTAMAGEIAIAGEKRTGQQYETVTVNESGEDRVIHLIPKEEHLIVDENDYVVVWAYSEDFSKILNDNDLYFESTPEVFYPFRWIKNTDWFIDDILTLNTEITNPMYESIFALSVNGESDAIYIKFVDVPLLTTNEKIAPSWKPVIEGEEETGKTYPTVTKYFEDYDTKTKKVVLGQRKVHLIPKEEKIRFDNVNDSDVNFFMMETFDFSDSKPNISESDFDGDGIGFMKSQTTDGKWELFEKETLNEFQTIPYETGNEDIIWCLYPTKSGNSWDFEIVVDVNEDGNVIWYSGERAMDTDAYFFRFTDDPLLTEDTDTPEEENKATPSEATPSEPEKPTDKGKGSSGESSSGGGSGRVVSAKKTEADTYPNATWQIGENGTWILKKSNGELVKGWAKVKGIWYHMNLETGFMTTGWFTDTDGKIYYLTNIGAMLQGWNHIDNKWYYFETSGFRFSGWLLNKDNKWYYLGTDGIMLADTTTPDGYNVDSNGAWIR